MSTSAYTHNVNLTARDGISQPLARIGQTVRTTAAQFTAAARSSSVFSRGFTETAEATESLSNSLLTFSGHLSGFNALQIENQRVVNAVAVAYGDSADQVYSFAQALAEASNYSDEAARQATVIGSTLVRNYDIATEGVEELTQRSADLAALYGFELTDAMQRSTAAIRGEAESAEALYVTLSDTFLAAEAAKRGIDGWTTSMTEAEKAAFRLTVFMEQTEYATGAAARQAEGARGIATDIRQQFSDMAAGFGGVLGPLGDASIVMADLSRAAPIAIEALGKLNKVSLAGLAGQLAQFGPKGLIVGGAVAGIGLLVSKVLEWNQVASDAADPTDELAQSLNRLRASGDEAGAVVANDINQTWNQVAFSMSNAEESLASLNSEQDIYQEMAQDFVNRTAEQRSQMQTLADQIQRSIDANEKYAASGEEINRVSDLVATTLEHQGDNASEVRERTLEILDSYNQLGSAGVIAALEELVSTIDTWGKDLVLASDATKVLTGDQQKLLETIYEETAAIWESETARAAQRDAALAAIQALNAESRLRLGLDELSDPSGALIHTPAENEANERSLAAYSARRSEERRQQMIEEAQEQKRLSEEIQDIEREAAEERERLAEQRMDLNDQVVDAERDGARAIEDAERNRIQAQRQLEQDYAQELRTLQNQRVDAERQTSQEVQAINRQRAEATAEAEQELADLAEERQEIQARAAAEAAEAELQWRETVAASRREQAEAQSALNESIQEAQEQFEDFTEQNIEAQRRVREELRRTLQDQQLAFDRDREDRKRELAQAQQDLQNAQDPEFYDAEAVASAKRRIEELRIEEKRSREDRKREEADAKREAKQQLDDLQKAQLDAQEEYHEKVRELEEETAEKIAQLEEDRRAAQEEWLSKQRDASAEVADQLQALADQEAQIVDDRTKRLLELERERRIVMRDAAREQQVLTRETEQAQEQLGKSMGKAAAIAAREATTAARGAQSTINDLREELEALTKEQYTVNIRVRERTKEAEEDDEPLDGPPPKRYLGGPIPAAAYGRANRGFIAGEYGPEYITESGLVIPFGASQARSDYPGGGTHHHYHFPNATFALKTPDLAKQVATQVNQMRRSSR